MGLPAIAGMIGLGLGTGYVGDKLFGDGKYGWGEGAADSIMGAVGGGVAGGVASKLGSRFLPAHKLIDPAVKGALGPVNRVVNPWLGRTVSAGRGVGSSIPFFNHAESAGEAGELGNVFASIPNLFANVAVGEESAPDPYAGFNSYWKNLSSKYRPAEFQGKTMMQYMDDPDAQRIVDENISAANKPHREAIRDEKRQLKNDLHNIDVLENEYQREHRRISKRGVEQSASIQKGYADATSDIRSDADEALNNILAMYNTADDKSQREIATSAAENRVDAPGGSSGAAAMAEVNRASLAELGAISEQQSGQDKRDRTAEASQSIRQSRRGISDNAAQRRGMIAELAKSLAGDDLQKFGLDIDNAGKRNSFLTGAIQMYPSFMPAASGAEAQKSYEKKYGQLKAIGEAIGQGIVPIEVATQNKDNSTSTQQLLPAQWATYAQGGGLGEDAFKQAQAMQSQGYY